MKTSELGMTSKRWIAKVFQLENLSTDWFSFWLIGSDVDPDEKQVHFGNRLKRYVREVNEVDVLDVQWQDMSKIDEAIETLTNKLQTVRNEQEARRNG